MPFIFRTITDTTWKPRNGEEVEVLGPVPPESYDFEDVGPMTRVRFPDGAEVEAFDDEILEITETCRHCDRPIGYDQNEGWIDPEAGYDDEDGDGIWRTTCDSNHEDRIAAHEPVGTYGSDEPDEQALADADDALARLQEG